MATLRIQNNGQDLQIKAGGNPDLKLGAVDITLKPGVNEEVDAGAWAEAVKHGMVKHHTDTDQKLPDRNDPHGQRSTWGKRLVVLGGDKKAAAKVDDPPAGDDGKGAGGDVTTDNGKGGKKGADKK